MDKQRVLRWVLGGLGVVMLAAALIWIVWGRSADMAPAATPALTGTPLPFIPPEPTPTLHPDTPPGENASLVCGTSLIVIIIIGAVLAIRLRKPPK